MEGSSGASPALRRTVSARSAEDQRRRGGVSGAATRSVDGQRLGNAARIAQRPPRPAIQAIAAPQNIDKVEAAVREELVRLVADGITADELRDAVSGLLTEREQARADDGSVAGMLQDQLYFGRTMQFTADLDDKYRALTLDQVNAAIRKHLDPARLSVFAAGDFAAAAKAGPATRGSAAAGP